MRARDTRIVLTDLGGVVMKFNELPGHSCIYDRFSVLSGRSVEEVGEIIGFNTGPHGDFGRGLINSQQFYRLLCDRLGIAIGWETFRYAWGDIFLPNFPVIDLLRKVKKNGYKIGLISNLDEIHWDWMQKYFAACIDFLDWTFLSFELGHMKPDRGYSKAVAGKLRGYPRKSIVAIDDFAPNTEEFRSFGFNAVHYTGDNKKFIADLKKLGVEV